MLRRCDIATCGMALRRCDVAALRHAALRQVAVGSRQSAGGWRGGLVDKRRERLHDKRGTHHDEQIASREVLQMQMQGEANGGEK